MRVLKMNNEQQLNNSEQSITNKHKRFDADFIAQVVGVYKSGVYKSAKECANAYGISDKTLYAWLSKHNKLRTPEALLTQQEENVRLKKELARAKMELEILKKASIYFANLAR
jgi:transposase